MTEVRRLLQDARPDTRGPVTAEEMPVLPEPVARHLRSVGVVGARAPRTVYLRQSGEMRMAPGKGWVALEAEEWFSLEPPAFVWQGTIRPAPVVRISAVDRFIDGHGSMQISAWGRIPVGKVSGPETDSGELMRFLVESMWFPAFWLSPRVRWEAIDERAARLSIQVNEVAVAARIEFAEDGLVCAIESKRYRTVGKQFELTPWRGRCWDYREVDGVRVPHRIAVTWGLPEGDFEWFRESVEELRAQA
jgi:hypothetical protein